MPVRVPRAGTRRSGQGVAPPSLGRPIVRNFEPTQRMINPFLYGAGGSESMPADMNVSRRMEIGFSDEETYGFEDLKSEEEMVESLLRQFICQVLHEVDNRIGAIGVWGRAPTDLGLAASIKPDLGDRLYTSDSDLVDEDEDDLHPNVTEFSSVSGGASGPSIAGYVLPLGKKSPTYGRKRKRSSQAVRGFKSVRD